MLENRYDGLWHHRCWLAPERQGEPDPKPLYVNTAYGPIRGADPREAFIAAGVALLPESTPDEAIEQVWEENKLQIRAFAEERGVVIE